MVFPKEKPWFLQKIGCRSWHRLIIDFTTISAPFFLPNSTKIEQYIDLNKNRKNDRFLRQFLFRFGVQLARFSARFSRGSRSNRFHSASWRSTFLGKILRTPVETSETDFVSIWNRFLHDLASIQGPHGTIFGIKTTSVFQVDATKGSENTISKWKGSAAAAAASKLGDVKSSRVKSSQVNSS